MSKVLVDSAALRYLALNWELWGAGHNRDLFVRLLSEVRSHPTGPTPSDPVNSMSIESGERAFFSAASARLLCAHGPHVFSVLCCQLSQLLWDRNPNSAFNAHRLHSLGMVRWTLSIMMQAAKLAAAGTPGWALPRVTLEDAHWGRSGGAGGGLGGDELLNTCAELLHQLLATRMTDADMCVGQS